MFTLYCSHISCDYSTDIPSCEFCDSAPSFGRRFPCRSGSCVGSVNSQVPGKSFFFPPENLAVQHKMRFYWVETSRIETVGSHRVAARAREQPVSQPACLHNWDLMVCSEEGQGGGEQPGSPALSRRCGQEETTGGAWAELVLRCMVPRAEANA